ncbi:hypothetical protein NXS19_011203 [Fusarium pseudograminearum]|nr:hypothetical protein NXS19_011203 [Fusarium pseudograminearum]
MADIAGVSVDASAVIQQGKDLAVAKISLPRLQDHQVYVRVDFAAFNPTDRLGFDLQAFGDGAVLGCDFVGTVTHTHQSVNTLEVGDKIAALVWGGEIKSLGAYSTYCIADERISFKLPATVESREACAIPLAINTAYLALFSEASLNLQKEAPSNDCHILIWGGSSVVGYFAIQLARLHGYVVTTTCSAQNIEYLKKAGATHVFDYNDPDVVAKIRSLPPSFGHAFDTIGSIDSSSNAAAALNEDGVFCTVRPGKANTQGIPKSIKVTDVFVFTAFPTPHTYRGAVHWPVIWDNHYLSAELYKKIPELLSKGLIVPPRVRNMGRLSPATLTEAMELNRAGKVSAQKLYFEVS